MIIQNKLIEESFIKENLQNIKAVTELNDISEYCSKINEHIIYDVNKFFDLDIEDDIKMLEYLYDGEQTSEKQFIFEMMKLWKSEKQEYDKEILCSLAEYQGASSDLKEYVHVRQEILEEVKDKKEFSELMVTCFPNSVFSKECVEEFTHIKKFEESKKEIVRNLRILDEKAIEIYEKYKNNIVEAYRCLGSYSCACGTDPKHADKCIFTFEYEIEQNGEKITQSLKIPCQPHLKLIRKDSNLRIYFYWKDDKIKNGKKVLIGKVGGHTWSRYER